MGNSNVSPHAYCHFCGHDMQYAKSTDDGGEQCARCARVVYQNAIPVAVLIAPCGPTLEGDNAVFAVRRGIEPHNGELALPGGFIMKDETWEAAACREAQEELGLICRHAHVEMEHPKSVLTKSSDDGSRILIVGAVRGVFYVGPFERNVEAAERVVYHPHSSEQLCFPIHRQALALYWESQGIEHSVQV